MHLREALARALGDPSLQLAFWFPPDKHYLDSDGAPVTLPDEHSGRSSTFVARDGQPIAVLLHDPVLEHNAELVSSVSQSKGGTTFPGRAARTALTDHFRALLLSRCEHLELGGNRPAPRSKGDSATGATETECRSAPTCRVRSGLEVG